MITANADNNLQRCERGKLGRMHKPSTHTTSFIRGDDVIGELYQKKHGPHLIHNRPLGTIWSHATSIPHHHPPSTSETLVNLTHQQ